MREMFGCEDWLRERYVLINWVFVVFLIGNDDMWWNING